MKGKWPNGLADAMERKGLGLSDLVRIGGLTNRQTALRYRDGERKLPIELARRLAPVLDTTADALLLLPDLPEAKVAGRVGAGGAIIDVAEDTSDLPRIPVLAGDIEGAGVVEIVGPSLGPFEGWYAVIGKRAKFHDELYGRLCVVQTREDGQIFIKWVERTRRKGVKLISGDGTVERDGTELEWAAPVIGMRPR